jgi:hypothetical protein
MTFRCAFLHAAAIAAAALLCTVSACSTQKASRSGYLCAEHSIHRATVKEEFAACFQIRPDQIDEYYIFERDVSVSDLKNVNSAASQIKDTIANDIVDLIMKRLEAAYGSELTSHWRLESIDIHVPFRRFILNEDGKFKIKVIALLKKDDLSPRSLIRFLPLEYKMNLVEPTSREMKMFKNTPIR